MDPENDRGWNAPATDARQRWNASVDQAVCQPSQHKKKRRPIAAEGKEKELIDAPRQSGIAKIRNSDEHPQIQPRNLILIDALIAS